MSTLKQTALADLILGLLRHIGRGVTVGELVHQACRHTPGVTATNVIEALCDLEERGLVSPRSWQATL